MKSKKSVLLKLSLFGIVILFFASCKQKSDGEQKNVPSDSIVSENLLVKLNKRIESDPNDADAYYSRSRYFLQKEILQQAFNDASKATLIDSTRPEYFLLLADISFRGLQIQKSVKAYEKCLQLDPRNVEANLKLGELFMYLKAYPKAINYANEALRIDSKRSKAYFIKGFVYKESGDTARAISSFTTVVEIDPESYDAYIQLGLLHAAKGDDLAIQYYSNALRIRPSSEEALYNRGLYYQEDNKFDKATEDYREILSKNKSYAPAYYNLGFIALVNEENYAEAIKQFTSAINADQNYVEAFYNRGLAYEYSGDKDSAIKDYRSALAIFPNYGLAKERLIEIGK